MIDSFGRFAPDAVLAYWDGAGDETAPRTLVRGDDAIEKLLRETGVASYQNKIEVAGVSSRFVEGTLRRHDEQASTTFVTSATLHPSGLVARVLMFHSSLVEPPDAPRGVRMLPPDATAAVVSRYLAHLVAGELADAVACFSPDCLYSHPPYAPGGARVAFRGREALLAGFDGVRGPRRSRPRVLWAGQHGANGFVEGVVEGAEGPKGSFVSSVQLEAQGLIKRYVAFYTATRVPA